MQFDEVLEKTGQTETMILREQTILTILTKLSRYEAECTLYENKYDASLESFRRKLEQKINFEFTDGSRYYVPQVVFKVSIRLNTLTTFNEIAHYFHVGRT